MMLSLVKIYYFVLLGLISINHINTLHINVYKYKINIFIYIDLFLVIVLDYFLVELLLKSRVNLQKFTSVLLHLLIL